MKNRGLWISSREDAVLCVDVSWKSIIKGNSVTHISACEPESFKGKLGAKYLRIPIQLPKRYSLFLEGSDCV